MSETFADLDDDVAAFPWSGELSCPPRGDGGFSFEERFEDAFFLVIADDQNANGVFEVGCYCDHGVCGLGDVFEVEFLDERGLNSSAASRKIGRIDGGGEGGWGEDGGRRWEDGLKEGGYFWCVGCTARENDLNID